MNHKKEDAVKTISYETREDERKDFEELRKQINVNYKITESKLNLNILDGIRNIPGGLMLIPMAIAAVINTFIPNVMRIGNPTTAIFSNNGTMSIVGMMLVFIGIQVAAMLL